MTSMDAVLQNARSRRRNLAFYLKNAVTSMDVVLQNARSRRFNSAFYSRILGGVYGLCGPECTQ